MKAAPAATVTASANGSSAMGATTCPPSGIKLTADMAVKCMAIMASANRPTPKRVVLTGLAAHREMQSQA